MQSKLILSDMHKNMLARHAKEAEPLESCALLIGTTNKVFDLFFTDNVAEDPARFFTMSAEQIIKGYKIAQERGLEVVGIFHSHPSSEAYPSETDKKYMQYNPVTWIIYSGSNEKFRGYCCPDNEIVEVQIETSTDAMR